MCIRECGSTLYVGMAQGVSFFLCIGIGVQFQNMQKTGEEDYVELNIERSYCKLTLKVSEHILLWNNRASKLPVFVFFFAEALGLVTGRTFPWLLVRQLVTCKAQMASASQNHAFTLCVLPLSIEGIRLLNRIHLRGWGLKLTLTAVFFFALGTKVRGVRSKITLVGKCISASNCISGKRPFFRSLSSPIPSLITALPQLACTS